MMKHGEYRKGVLFLAIIVKTCSDSWFIIGGTIKEEWI